MLGVPDLVLGLEPDELLLLGGVPALPGRMGGVALFGAPLEAAAAGGVGTAEGVAAPASPAGPSSAMGGGGASFSSASGAVSSAAGTTASAEAAPAPAGAVAGTRSRVSTFRPLNGPPAEPDLATDGALDPGGRVPFGDCGLDPLGLPPVGSKSSQTQTHLSSGLGTKLCRRT